MTKQVSWLTDPEGTQVRLSQPLGFDLDDPLSHRSLMDVLADSKVVFHNLSPKPLKFILE